MQPQNEETGPYDLCLPPLLPPLQKIPLDFEIDSHLKLNPIDRISNYFPSPNSNLDQATTRKRSFTTEDITSKRPRTDTEIFEQITAVFEPVVSPSHPLIPDPVFPQPQKPLENNNTQPPSFIQSDNGKRCWKILKSIGKGGCGEVFLAKEQNQREVALKIVKDRKQFIHELEVMKRLNLHENGPGFTPRLIHACKKKKAIIMEYLSGTVASKFEAQKFKFSCKTILMLAIDMMRASVLFFQRSGFVHVDLKPSNLCIGNGKKIYLIDFGYATAPDKRLPGQTGTPLFMSWAIQTYGTIIPTLQDDLESIGYITMFFLAGGKHGLPWGKFKTHKEIAAIKNDETIHQFINNISAEYHVIKEPLLKLLKIARDRTFTFEYSIINILINDFMHALRLLGFKHDSVYDWT